MTLLLEKWYLTLLNEYIRHKVQCNLHKTSNTQVCNWVTNLALCYCLFPCTCHYLQFSIVGQVGKSPGQTQVNVCPLKPIKESWVNRMEWSNPS